MAYTLVPTELIVDGAVTSAKLDTNISISGTLGVTGELTLATHMNMGDNDKIKIGTGGDLEIYHDGSNSYISNSTGNIYLADTNGSVHIQAKLNEESIVCTADGAVTLYHDNSAKLATTSTGIDVTGTVVADKFDLGTTTDADTVSTTASDYQIQLGAAQSTTGDIGRNISFGASGVTTAAINSIDGGTSNAQSLGFYTGNATSLSERMRITSGGTVAVNTTSPDSTVDLHVNGGTDNVPLGVESTDSNVFIAFKDSGTTGTFGSAAVAVGANSNNLLFRAGSAERARINSSGGLGIGTTAGTGYQLDITGQSGYDDILRLTAVGTNIGARINLTNTGTGVARINSTNNSLALQTAGVERMRINSGGDLLLGTTSGTAVKLNVQSSKANGLAAEISNTQSSTGSGIVVKGGNNSSTYSADFRDYNNTNLMRLTGEGKLGLGTTSPSTKLEVYDGSLTLNAPSATGNAWTFYKNSDRTYLVGIRGSSSDALSFYDLTADVERMRIDSSGRLGVGCTPTGYATEIQATTGGNGLKIRGRSAGGNEGWLAWTDNADNVEAAMYATADNLIFANTTSYTERMRIDSSGNVGIGTTSPNFTLGIHKATASSNYMQITNSDTGSGSGDGFLIGVASDEAATIWNQENTRMAFGTNNTERMRIDSSGRLLIGQTSAINSSILQAGGNSVSGGVAHIYDNDVSVASSNVILKISFTNDDVCTDGQLIAFHDLSNQIGSIRAGSGTTVNYNTSSDERLKENIVDASSQLDVINNIQVREFDWKKGGHHDVGMIAQELHSVIPNVVTEGADDVTEEPWSIDYGKLTPYLIKAIQEQQTIIDDLKSRIETLEG